MGIPRGTQWWFLGMLLHYKLPNVTQTTMKLQRGVVIAMVYVVNNYDRDCMVSPMNPVSVGTTGLKHDKVVEVRDEGMPPERHNTGGYDAQPPRETRTVDLGDANFGQLS